MAGGKKNKGGPSASGTANPSKAGAGATAVSPGRAGAAGKGAKTGSPAGGAKGKGAGAAAAEGVPLEELFARLAAHAAKNEYSKAIKAADESTLSTRPSSPEHCTQRMQQTLQAGALRTARPC